MERVTINCRCGECIVGEEVNNDGVKRIFCHTNHIYMNHESFCDTGRKKVEQEDGTFEPEYFHRCPHCTAIVNFMGDKVNYCSDCGAKVDWENKHIGLTIVLGEDGLADVVKEVPILMTTEDMEQAVALLEKKDCDFSRDLLDQLLEMFKQAIKPKE